MDHFVVSIANWLAELCEEWAFPKSQLIQGSTCKVRKKNQRVR